LSFPTSGGLATGLRTLKTEHQQVMVGWPGIWPVSEKERRQVKNLLQAQHSYPIFLSPAELEKYYYGFTNKTIWPLFHYFSTYCSYEESEWQAYKKVNQKFLKKIAELAAPDDMFWIHDYHLMLLPSLLREKYPDSAIGFFLHIPFPSSEVFRSLPWRTEVLEGLLGSDLIGFHTYEYARHFLSSVLRLLGLEHEFGALSVKNRVVRVENFPMGIDFGNFTRCLEEDSIKRNIARLKEDIKPENRKIILSVDRLDYSKGITQRLQGFELFLEKNPRWHNRFIYIMLSVPSRTKVMHYSLLKEEVEGLVGKINGRFGSPSWTPIHYLYRSLPFKKLLPLYAVADIALVSPLRDGMNLVAKEFIAAKNDNRGVLILSETAGAASELGEALLINVNNKGNVSATLSKALEMGEDEQKSRMRLMRKRLYEYDIFYWTDSFINRLEEVKKIQARHEHRKLNTPLRKKIIADYTGCKKRLLLLDYDGTLVNFNPDPQKARPDKKLLSLLSVLAENPLNKLVIISGRDSSTLEKWIGHLPCAMIAEHGALIKDKPSRDWDRQREFSTEWKEQVRSILYNYSVHLPGSFVEEKKYGIAWHYRNANPELGQIRSSELFEYLSEFLANTDLQVIHGNKVIEVRMVGINKGEATKYFLKSESWDFILAIGDDWTDEDIFKILPPSAYSIKVGFKPTQARFYLDSVETCRHFLELLSKE
jgi:trehalose 6-phosphate synthase/phosphatase